jgi:hypothetical protein
MYACGTFLQVRGACTGMTGASRSENGDRSKKFYFLYIFFVRRRLHKQLYDV